MSKSKPQPRVELRVTPCSDPKKRAAAAAGVLRASQTPPAASGCLLTLLTFGLIGGQRCSGR